MAGASHAFIQSFKKLWPFFIGVSPQYIQTGTAEPLTTTAEAPPLTSSFTYPSDAKLGLQVSL